LGNHGQNITEEAKMAVTTKNVVIYLEEQIRCSNVETSVNCVNCALVEKQLHSTLLELKSAEAIISLLHEDIKNASHATSSDLQTPPLTCETSGYDQANEKWSSVMYNNKMKKNSCIKYNEYGISIYVYKPLCTAI
jgi:hypothetical protein